MDRSNGQTADSPPPPPAQGRGGGLLDPGWLFLVAGVALLGAIVVVPAQADLDEVNFYLERARAAEEHRLARMTNYARYLDALNRNDEATILSLAAMQLNKAPEQHQMLVSAGDVADRSASVFAALEPGPLVLPEREVTPSRLERWATDDAARLWLMAAGVVCVLIGMLPLRSRG
jgi:hypothetical protein